eukprot:6201751-Pleurochrysis_carterae.AAC.1
MPAATSKVSSACRYKVTRNAPTVPDAQNQLHTTAQIRRQLNRGCPELVPAAARAANSQACEYVFRLRLSAQSSVKQE